MNARDLSNDGFTLIELIISIAIVSILVIGIYSIIFVSTKTMNFQNEEDDYLVSGTYVIEYLSDEIRNGDYILPSYMIKNLDSTYPFNLKYVILNIDDKTNNYVTYYYTGKDIVRLSYQTDSTNLPDISKFNGYNKLDAGITDIGNSGLDIDNNMIYLDFTFGEEVNFKISSGINVENKIYK